MTNDAIISASILSADFSRLGEEVRNVLAAGADHIHFDVMDHHYVPNLSFGSVVCESLRKSGITAPIDVHLMVENPQHFFSGFSDAGANLITFHPETVTNIEQAFQELHDFGLQVGLAFNPDQEVDIPLELLQDVDMILIMTVTPGFGGQALNQACIEKIERTRERLDKSGSKAWLGVDGGIKVDNAAKIAKAGADFFVVGSGLFHAPDYQKYLADFRAAISQQ
jgi:ribulose-phosphate 3-epimerase